MEQDVYLAIMNEAPDEIVELIRQLRRQHQALGQLRSEHKSMRAHEAIDRIRLEIDGWTRDLGHGWRT